MNELIELLRQYIVEDGLIMVPVLYIIAETIKGTSLLESRFLPPVLMGISAVLTPLVIGGYSPDNIVQAILVTGLAVWTYNFYDKTLKGGEKNE